MSLFKKILSPLNYLTIYLLIIFSINIFFQFLPLVNVFGFEFSVFNSMLLVFLSGLYNLNVVKGNLKEIPNAEIKKQFLIAFSSFLVLPVLISIINSFLTLPCSLFDGFFFYIVITFPSVIIGGALGLICFIFIKRFSKTTFVLLYIFILLIPLAEFYFNPQIYFYNPIFAYIPGTIYDEGLSVDLRLLSYRVLNLVFFGVVFLILFRIIFNQLRLSKKILVTGFLIIPALFLYLSQFLGYSTTYNTLTSELNKVRNTEHFIIHYSHEIDEKMMDVILLHHEYYYLQLKDFFKISLNKKIESFVFADSDQKKKLFGSENADVAKPWQYSIYTTYYNYNITLRHEIAHCFSAEFGTGIFKVADNINPSLIEGIATAASPFFDENDVDYMAALAYNFGFKVDLNDLYGYTTFFRQASSLSYIYAGSFTKFLIDEYGIEKIKKLYSNLEFEEIYDVSLESLQKKYFANLENFDIEQKEHSAYYYFGRKSIFYKVCPRYIGNKLEEGWNHLHNKEYERAINIFEGILETTDNYSALIGLSRSLSEMNRKTEAITLLEQYISQFDKTAYYYNIEFELADLYAGQFNFNKADSLYNKIFNHNPNRILYYLTGLRKELLNRDSLLIYYLTGSDFDKYSILQDLNLSYSQKLKKYIYNSIPVMIDLSKRLKEDYRLFVQQFDKTIYVNDYESSFAMYKLSIYLLENLDFINARKMSALSLRYTSDKNFNSVLKNNFDKTNWMYFNAAKYLSTGE